MTSTSDPSKKVPNLADVPDEDETLVIKVSFHLLFGSILFMHHVYLRPSRPQISIQLVSSPSLT